MKEERRIYQFLAYSANKIDRIIDSAILKKDRLKHSIMDKKVQHYIYLSEEELDTYLHWDKNEITVYLYLKFRCDDDDCIQASRECTRECIMKATCISHSTATKAVHAIENRKLILVKRKDEQHHLIKEQRERNIYTLLEEQSS